MDKWMKVALAVSVPTLSFLVLQDTVQGMYGPRHELPLSYVVVEPEELAAEEEAVLEETAPVEEAVAEDTAAADAAPAEPDASADAPTEETEMAVDDAATDEAAPVETAEADAPVVETTDDVLMAALSPDEMKAGEAAARTCASCHQLARDRNAVGPHLVGLAGRPIGGVDGFRYSDALIALNAEGAVWDAANLEAWLEDPDAFAEGTKMMFNVRDAEERRLIAGWLIQREE